MAMLKFLVTGMLAMASAVNAAYPNPGPVKGALTVHDPTVVKTPAGGYIMAHTGDNVALKTSSDRTTWKEAGPAFPNGAPWTTQYTKGEKNLWAPDISYHNGQYYMYYSASSFGERTSAIFMATSKTGASGSWTNQGLVIESNNNNDYNAIDGNLYIDTDGKWWLSFGSFWSGIKLVQLDPKTGKPINKNIISLAKRDSSVGGAIEAPFIVKRGNYYYLWASFDKCCNGAASTYRVMVGRSSSITGPYVDKAGKQMMSGGGTEIMASHGDIHGPGHNAVFADSDADVLVYHYYNNQGTALLGINLLRYDNGWPVAY